MFLEVLEYATKTNLNIDKIRNEFYDMSQKLNR